MESVQPLPRAISPAKLRALPKAPSWARLSIGVLAKLAPSLTLDQLHRLYFSPLRYHASSEERAVISDATRSEETVAGHRVVRYAWENTEFPWDPPLTKTALLVHGWAGAAAQMTAFVQPLLRAGYRVEAFDWHAHGKAPGQRTNLVETSEVLRAIVTPDTAVVAHSLGASAVLIALQHGMVARRLALLAAGAALDAYPRRFAEAAGAPELGDALTQRLHAEFGDAVLQPAKHQALRFVTTPTLLVHDLDDGEAPYHGSLTLQGALRDARLATTAGLGHRRLLRDAPVIDEVMRFLA